MRTTKTGYFMGSISVIGLGNIASALGVVR